LGELKPANSSSKLQPTAKLRTTRILSHFQFLSAQSLTASRKMSIGVTSPCLTTFVEFWIALLYTASFTVALTFLPTASPCTRARGGQSPTLLRLKEFRNHGPPSLFSSSQSKTDATGRLVLSMRTARSILNQFCPRTQTVRGLIGMSSDGFLNMATSFSTVEISTSSLSPTTTRASPKMPRTSHPSRS